MKEGYKKTELGEIPENWEIKELNDIAVLITKGTTPTTYGFEFVDKGINFVKIESINEDNGTLKKETFAKISAECHDKLSRSKLEDNDILFAIAGATVGKCALVKYEYLPANTNQALAIIRLNREKAYYKYIFHQLRSFIIQNKISNLKTNTAQPNLNLKQIGEFNIVLPLDKKEQQKIADILSTVDIEIEQTDALIEKTKELKKGLMQRLLTKGIGHTEFKKTEVGEIPLEWEVKSFKQIGEIVTGSTPKTSESENYGNEYLWVSPTDMGENKYIYKTNKMLSDIGFNKTRKIPKGSVLVTCIGSTIGKIGIASEELSTNQQINSLICSTKYNNEYIYYSIDYNFKRYISFISIQAVPIINKTVYSEFMIPIPPKEEQDKIANILSEVDIKIENYIAKKRKLQTLKQGLMQKLLTGKIRVKVS